MCRYDSLEILFKELHHLNYVVVGYKVVDNVLRLTKLDPFKELIRDVEDVQNPGKYSLIPGNFYMYCPDSVGGHLYPYEGRTY